ncbi:hypothetical protein PFAG_01236 [Plasmodium falciparum Santa Lucia]|uniref:Uncharacterized protein n=1 Tax=Plasmodium falciparum Santa Lucia TaxID=478859 RepID=W7FMG5_PLAFA|nr:hypothetical protein PFAG_01236 [Plasmodium falciparum Santa Lucia]
MRANVIFSVSKNVREYIKVRSLEYMKNPYLFSSYRIKEKKKKKKNDVKLLYRVFSFLNIIIELFLIYLMKRKN